MHPAMPPPLPPVSRALLHDLQSRLAEAASSPSAPACRAHRTHVLPSIPTRGARIPQIRAAVADWARVPTTAALSVFDARALATEIVVGGACLDDVLAGVFWVGEWLLGSGVFGVMDFAVFGAWFAAGGAGLRNYLGADEFAEKVVRRLIDAHGEGVVEGLRGWFVSRGAAGEAWRVRAGLVGLMGAVKAPWAREIIREGCVALARLNVGEAKSAIGTALRAVARDVRDDEGQAVEDVEGKEFVRGVLGDEDVLLSVGGTRGGLQRALGSFDAGERRLWRESYKALLRRLGDDARD